DRSPCLRLASALAARSEDADDPHLPLIIWWAMEPHFTIPALATQGIKLPSAPKMRDFLAERIARRMVASDLRLADSPARRGDPAPPQARRNRLAYTPGLLADTTAPAAPAFLRGIEAGLDGRSFDQLLPPMATWLDQLNAHFSGDDNLFRIRIRFNHRDPLKDAHPRLADAKRPDAEKVKLIQLLGQVRRPASLPGPLDLFRNCTPYSFPPA